jgi:hypothetical protein
MLASAAFRFSMLSFRFSLLSFRFSFCPSVSAWCRLVVQRLKDKIKKGRKQRAQSGTAESGIKFKRVVKNSETGAVSKSAVNADAQRSLRKVPSSIGVVDQLLQQVRRPTVGEV